MYADSSLSVIRSVGADPEFSEQGIAQMSAYITNCYYLTSPFSQEKVWSNIYVCFTLGGSTEPPEPPLDPLQKFAGMCMAKTYEKIVSQSCWLNISELSHVNFNLTSITGSTSFKLCLISCACAMGETAKILLA